MLHWIDTKRATWNWSRRPSPSALAPADFLILAALNRSQALEADVIAATLSPTLALGVIQESLGHLMQHGLVHRLARNNHFRYKLSRAGSQFLADSVSPR